ncbi:MAG: DUF881 domain-containing protein [Streptosporangiales bacterium]|nr:DUF881 domain-containing protein [Streptosporangiales bacterium]
MLAGVLIAASGSTAHGTDLRSGDRTRLTDLITDEQHRYQEVRREVRLTEAEVERLTREAGRRDGRVRTARGEAERLAPRSGFTAVSGRGLRVVLDDAPRRADDAEMPGDPSPDDLVVHQQDVQAVVNALWAGGARAMQVMDQRVIATSAVRCVGNTLILQGVVYSPPFRIVALGDPARLRAALDAARGVRVYRQYVAAYGLGYDVRTEEHAELPPYQGAVTLGYAYRTDGAHNAPGGG